MATVPSSHPHSDTMSFVHTSDRETEKRDSEAASGQGKECEISHANTTEHKCAPCWWSRESRWGESAGGHRLTQCQNSSANRISFSLTASVSCSFYPTRKEKLREIWTEIQFIIQFSQQSFWSRLSCPILYDCSLNFKKQITSVIKSCFYQLPVFLLKLSPF